MPSTKIDLDELPVAPRARRPSGPMRKANETLVPIPVNSPLTGLQHSLWNALARIAQAQGIERPYYEATLPEIRRAYGSEPPTKDDRRLIEAIKSMQAILVTWHIIGSEPAQMDLEEQGKAMGILDEAADRRATSITGRSHWIGDIEIETMPGGTKKVRWTYGQLFKARFLSPTSLYTLLSLEQQSKLATLAARRLFEVACQFRTNPGGITARAPWRQWRPVLLGRPEPVAPETWGIHEEFKNWRRFVLDPAVAEVNSRTDIRVEPVIHRSGRIVTDIQFRVRQAVVELGAPVQPADMELLARVMRLGVSQSRAKTLLAKHPAEAIERAAALTEAKGGAVKSRAGWFVSALEGQWAEPEPAPGRDPASQAQRSLFDAREQALAELRAERAREALALHAELSESERAERYAQFVANLAVTGNALQATATRAKLRSPLVRAAFGQWLASEPTEADLTNYLLARQTGGAAA